MHSHIAHTIFRLQQRLERRARGSESGGGGDMVTCMAPESRPAAGAIPVLAGRYISGPSLTQLT